jgi:hypothetical protein
MRLRRRSACIVGCYMTHKTRAQISIKSLVVSSISYCMEQVLLCQASQRSWPKAGGLGGQGTGQVRPRPTNLCTSHLNRGAEADQPSIIGSKRADVQLSLEYSRQTAKSCYLLSYSISEASMPAPAIGASLWSSSRAGHLANTVPRCSEVAMRIDKCVYDYAC